MDTRTVERIVKSFQQTLAEDIDVTEIIIFGSHLEGTATEDSDLDVIVVSEDFATLSEDERLDILEDAAEATESLLHPWGFTPQEVAAASRLTTLGYARDAGLRIR